jgi:protein-export membrane protein SecD
LPGLTNIDQAIKLIGETPTLEFKLIQTATNSTTTLESIGLDGRYLKRAQVVFDPQLNSPQVSIEWNDVGTAIFASTTKNNLGKPLAIILDGVPVSAPIIQSEISDGKAVISGNFDREEARILAGRLNTGALPVAIKVIGSEVIQPTLGAKALNAGILATFYGFLAIALMMIVWYRIPGIVGVVSLLSYVFLVLSIFKFIPVTISAAAIAGFIISIGLAVDGNILIFERLKEELQKGKNLTDGVEEAFGRAWTSIRDSNLASLIAAIVLFYIGTSVVKGFALTLMIGVLTSMFTNVFITRYLLRSVLPNTNSNKIKNWFKSPF